LVTYVQIYQGKELVYLNIGYQEQFSDFNVMPFGLFLSLLNFPLNNCVPQNAVAKQKSIDLQFINTFQKYVT